MLKKVLLAIGMLMVLVASGSFSQSVIQPGDSVHCTGDALVTTGPLDADCVAFTPTPTSTPTETPTATLTNTPTSTPTDTPQPTSTPTATNTLVPTATWTPLPTSTATNTATPQPTATNTPVVATSTPRAQWPLCPSHDPNAWHALDDVSRQCHYDHEHGDNPHLADTVFGAWPSAWGGQELSYPWATSAMENTHKHGGYKFAVKLNMPCDVNASYDAFFHVNCIPNARAEYHTVGHAIDALARYHSYYLEYQICRNPDFASCGIIRVGGWMDFGLLNAPYAGPRVFRAGGVVDFGAGSTYGGAGANSLVMSFDADTPELNTIACCFDEPYISIGSMLQPLNGNKLSVWSMNNVGQANHFGSNAYARLLIRTFDTWGDIDPANPYAPRFFCRDGSCANNGSLRGMGETSVYIPPSWDSDHDGFADMSGYTNRLGQIVTGCAAIGLDCVPFSVVHVPVGYADTRDGGNGSGAAREFDTSPVGIKWLRFPN